MLFMTIQNPRMSDDLQWCRAKTSYVVLRICNRCNSRDHCLLSKWKCHACARIHLRN